MRDEFAARVLSELAGWLAADAAWGDDSTNEDLRESQIRQGDELCRALVAFRDRDYEYLDSVPGMDIIDRQEIAVSTTPEQPQHDHLKPLRAADLRPGDRVWLTKEYRYCPSIDTTPPRRMAERGAHWQLVGIESVAPWPDQHGMYVLTFRDKLKGCWYASDGDTFIQPLEERRFHPRLTDAPLRRMTCCSCGRVLAVTSVAGPTYQFCGMACMTDWWVEHQKLHGHGDGALE